MQIVLFLAGILAWAGVAVLAIAMAEWEEPVLGFFPILIAVFLAWGIGEYLTDTYLSREDSND